MNKLLTLITICSFLTSVFSLAVVAGDDSNAFDEEGLTTAQIVELRGFKARNHEVITSDGYILSLVEASNPLLEERSSINREPILFIHGIRTSAKNFIVNSINARPKDYSKLNLNQMSEKEVNDLLLEDPASKSLVFTALNFGHKVWLLNRRGSIESRRHVSYNLTKETGNHIEGLESEFIKTIYEALVALKSSSTFGFIISSIIQLIQLPPLELEGLSIEKNARYWNYSFDEQVQYDIPETVDYILKQSGQNQLVIVSHSAGGALTLLTQATNPAFRDKISKALLWAPALDLGGNEFSSFDPIFNLGSYWYSRYIGPSPMTQSIPIIAKFFSLTCGTQIAQDTICASTFDQMYGESEGQLDLKPGFLSSSQDIVSSHEYSQLIQSFLKGKTHKFDFGSSQSNTIAYGQAHPPVYNLSKIDTEGISIWYGNTDSLVKPKAIEQILSDLKVPVEKHFLNQSDIYFNHVAFQYHKNIASVLIIPSLKTIHSQY